MTQDEIIRMARETGFFINRDGEIESPLEEGYAIDEYLERFAALVAAHEKKFWMEQIEVECNEAVLAEREKQAEQEPVGVVTSKALDGVVQWKGWIPRKGTKLYAAPVQQVDLTDDEILEITKRFALGIAFPVDGVTTPEMFARAVIAADREKNK